MIPIISKSLEKGSHELDSDKIKTVSGRADLIDQLTREYTQKKWSRMHSDIQAVTSFDKDKTTYLAVRACKVFGLWIELYSKGMLSQSFEEYFAFLSLNKMVDLDNCKLKVEQKSAYSTLRSSNLIKDPMNFVEVYNLKKFKEFMLGENWIGTVRIEPSKDKFHSMTVYNYNGTIKLSDISYRGTRVDPWKYITPDNFRYFTTFLKHTNQEA